MRDLALLPKAHLHLHFTGSLRIATLRELAAARRVRLPESLTDAVALRVPADRRGWFRFQRQYDAARAVVKGEETIRRVVREAAEDDAAVGSEAAAEPVSDTAAEPTEPQGGPSFDDEPQAAIDTEGATVESHEVPAAVFGGAATVPAGAAHEGSLPLVDGAGEDPAATMAMPTMPQE